MSEKSKNDLKGSILIFVLTMAFWLLISTSVHWQHLLIGSIFCLILVLFWGHLQIAETKTQFTVKQVFLLIRYFIMLVIEVIKANIAVAIIVLSPKLNISPGIILTHCDLKRTLLRVLFVNSITLTPGTITLELEDNLLIVHAITEDMAEGVLDWDLNKRLLEMEALYEK